MRLARHFPIACTVHVYNNRVTLVEASGQSIGAAAMLDRHKDSHSGTHALSSNWSRSLFYAQAVETRRCIRRCAGIGEGQPATGAGLRGAGVTAVVGHHHAIVFVTSQVRLSVPLQSASTVPPAAICALLLDADAIEKRANADCIRVTVTGYAKLTNDVAGQQ